MARDCPAGQPCTSTPYIAIELLEQHSTDLQQLLPSDKHDIHAITQQLQQAALACTESVGEQPKPVTDQVQGLVQQYKQYMANHGGQPPPPAAVAEAAQAMTADDDDIYN